MFGLIIAFLVLSSALSGLLATLALRRHVKRWTQRRIEPESYPNVSVIAPHRGKINRQNIEKLLGQDYPGIWEILFVTTRDDISWRQLQKYSEEFDHVRIIPAEDAVELARRHGIHRYQKNSNIVAAVKAASPETEVYVFIDADASPMRDWLRKLIAPLTTGDPELGAVTSTRIYVPDDGLASWAQAAWILNSSSLLIGPWCYLWGGGVAIPKAVFEAANLLPRLDGREGGITTDDMSMGIGLRQYGYHILFNPDCLMLRYPPVVRETWTTVFHFTNRQLLQTWWTRKDLWLASLLTYGIRTPAMLCALAVAWWQPVALLSLIAPVVDLANGLLIRTSFFDLLPEDKRFPLKFWKVLPLPLLTPAIASINILTAPFRRKVRWSGIEYTRKTVIGYTGDFSWRSTDVTQ